jgi:hypothetical protein
MNIDKQFVLDYIADFLIYDYLAHGIVLILFFLLFAVSIIARKKILVAILIFFIAVLVLVFGPFVAKMAIDNTVRASKVSDLTYKQLIYIDDVIVKGKIHNRGKINFTQCEVDMSIIKPEENEYKQMLSDLKPIKKYRFVVNEKIKQNESYDFDFTITKFQIQKYKLKAQSKCK